MAISGFSPSAGAAEARGDDELAERYLRMANEAMTDLGMATTASDGIVPASDGSVELTTPAGDLDADQRSDLITVRYVPRTDFDPDLSLRYSRGYDVTVRGRKGVDGSQLWSYTEQAAALGAYPIRLASGNGVLVASYEINYPNLTAVYPKVFRLHLTALTGAGAVSWERTIAGPEVHVNFVGSTAAELPIFRGLLNAVQGPAQDVMVDTVQVVRRGGTPNAHPVQVQATVLDGATGIPASTATRQQVNADYYVQPFAMPGPDLDGDGLDDVVFVIQRGELNHAAIPSSPAVISASKGSNGAELWSTQAAQFGGWVSVVSVGDATGDGKADLAVATYAAAGQPSVFLLSGNDGSAVWSREGWEVHAIGDANGDGRPDVGIVSYSTGDDLIRITLEAVTPGGQTLYTEAHELHGVTGANSLEGFVELVGDVQPDGAADWRLHLGANFNDGRPRRESVVLASGATGRSLRGLDRERVLRGSVSGQGDDLVRTTSPDGGGVELTVTNGSNGSAVWSAVVGEGSTVLDTVIATADLDADGRDEVLVNAFTSAGTTFAVLDGRDGSSLWA
jgi:hypothetical protein